MAFVLRKSAIINSAPVGFNTSNVAFGVAQQQVDENKVWDALAAAQLDSHRIALWPLYTNWGQRISLSGGQRQRLALARAF